MKPVETKSDVYQIQQEETPSENSNDEEVKKFNSQKSNFLTSRNKDFLPQEVEDINTNDTEFSHTELSDTNFSDTTTTKNNKPNSKTISGGGIINNLEKELNIQITPKYKEQLLKYTKELNAEIINYGIEFAATYGNSPKQYLLKILSNWQKAGIQNLEQAKNYTHQNQNKKTTPDKEMTPKWLLDRDNDNVQEEKNVDHEENEKHEEERAAFLEQLKERWGDE